MINVLMLEVSFHTRDRSMLNGRNGPKMPFCLSLGVLSCSKTICSSGIDVGPS